MINAEITVAGLILDIIGVCLLWKFGLPPDVRRGGQSFLVLEQADENKKKKARTYDYISHAAIALIVLGFALQAVGTGALDSVFSRTPAASQTSPHEPGPQAKAASAAPPRPSTQH